MNSSTNDSKVGLMQMLNEIVANDQKSHDGFINVAPIAFWTQIFARYFLHINNPHHDDLLFYVKKSDDQDSQPEVLVYRRESNKSPGLGDPAYDWTETVYLNLILQQLEYTLTCAICTKVSKTKQEVIIHKKVSQQVYASPSKHNMEQKGKGAEMCYPNIFFTIDSFDQVWTDLTLNEGEMVCVEIIASDKSKIFNSVIFLGSVNYNALIKVYDKRARSVHKWATVMSLGLLRNSNSVEFVRMKGPSGKGYAEMAIQRYDEASIQSSSESSLDLCTCSTSSVASTNDAIIPCLVHTLHSSKSDSSLNKSTKTPSIGSSFQGHVKSNIDLSKVPAPSLPTLAKKAHSGSWKDRDTLKTHLTYVTLPWHKIILDVLQTFEKPTSAKKAVLNRQHYLR